MQKIVDVIKKSEKKNYWNTESKKKYSRHKEMKRKILLVRNFSRYIGK